MFDYEQSPDNLLYRLAHSFYAGDMATIVITENGDITWNWGVNWSEKLPDQASLHEFIRNTNTWRKNAGKPYLHTGKMVKPFTVEGSPMQRFTMQGGREFQVPALLTSCWQASDGSLGQVVVNYTREAVVFSVSLSGYEDRTITLLGNPKGS